MIDFIIGGLHWGAAVGAFLGALCAMIAVVAFVVFVIAEYCETQSQRRKRANADEWEAFLNWKHKHGA